MKLTRKELKVIKKDIQEQLKANIKIEDLYIKNFYYCGDNLYSGNNEDITLDGRITLREIEKVVGGRIQSECNYKMHEMFNLQIQIIEDEDNDIYVEQLWDITFIVECYLIDKWNVVEETFITLNI